VIGAVQRLLGEMEGHLLIFEVEKVVVVKSKVSRGFAPSSRLVRIHAHYEEILNLRVKCGLSNRSSSINPET
jgi:hypothetical protein